MTKFPSCLFWVLIVVAVISFVAINFVLGIIVGFLAWMSYKKVQGEISTREKTPRETTNEETKKLVGMLIREEETRQKSPFDYKMPDIIRRGSLPPRIHDILDEMKITTWIQLSLLDEKELLYQKCFGEEALGNLKTELAKRGLTLNSPNTPI